MRTVDDFVFLSLVAPYCTSRVYNDDDDDDDDVVELQGGIAHGIGDAIDIVTVIAIAIAISISMATASFSRSLVSVFSVWIDVFQFLIPRLGVDDGLGAIPKTLTKWLVVVWAKVGVEHFITGAPENLPTRARAKRQPVDDFKVPPAMFLSFFMIHRWHCRQGAVAELAKLFHHVRARRARRTTPVIIENNAVDVGEQTRMLVKRSAHHDATQRAIVAIE
jgi:hypothetical protein